MEEELRQFKEKIVYRFKNGQIANDFKFPRLTDEDATSKPLGEMLIFSPQA